MTANELRASVGLQTHEEELLKWISKLEDDIVRVATSGSRLYISKIHPTPLGTEITQYFLKGGFYVTHYVSPFDEIQIRW